MDEKQLADMINQLILKHANKVVNNNAVTDITVTGHIKALPNGSEKRYQVSINGQNYLIPAPSYLTLAVGDIVIIMYHQGDANKKFVMCKKEWNCW